MSVRDYSTLARYRYSIKKQTAEEIKFRVSKTRKLGRVPLPPRHLPPPY
jgi:hypothetical protein